jgi:hypothetical protein
VRILSAGPLVKVELQSEQNGPIHVEMSHDQFRMAGLHENDAVFVTPHGARVFVEDFSI